MSVVRKSQMQTVQTWDQEAKDEEFQTGRVGHCEHLWIYSE